MNIPEEQQKPVWTARFWREKIIRTVIAGLLVVVLVLLWNWDTPTEVETEPVVSSSPTSQSTTAAQEQTQEPVEQAPVEPPAPVFPYTIVLDETVTRPDIDAENIAESYLYTFADGATMTIYPKGLPAQATDVTWEYTVATDGAVTITDASDVLCTAGSEGCSANNGQIDILVVPAEGETTPIVIQIVDRNVATKTVTAAADFYESVINTMVVAQ